MYDLIIIGTGPAGYTAGIYSAVYKLNTLVLGYKPGGYAADAFKILNYPGYPEISGIELMNKFKLHMEKLNVPLKNEHVISINHNKNSFIVITENNKYETKSIILASGSERRSLHIPGEKEFIGKGVAFCATCDAIFFKNKTTAVIGGSDSALTAAIQLSEICKHVYLIFRKDNPTGLPKWIEQINKTKNVSIIPKTNVTKIIGHEHVEKIGLDKPFNESSELKVDGVFIEIGAAPLTSLLKNLNVKIDRKGFIEVNNAEETSIKGIFASGDVTNGSNNFEQIVTAASEGAIAANSVFKYIQSIKNQN